MPNHPCKEPFIPISRFALLESLKKHSNQSLQPEYTDFLQRLAVWKHQQYREQLLLLKELYLPFSPDRDTITVLKHDNQQLLAMQERLIAELSVLLERANYTAMTKTDLEEIFSQQSEYGLQLEVDLSEFKHVLMYSRGSNTAIKQRRTLSSLFLKKEEYEVPIFQRMFLLIKLKPEDVRLQEIMQEENIGKKQAQKKLKKLRAMLPENISSSHIYLKIFKKIPQIDLEMLFPNTKVRLKSFDKLKLGITAGGGTAGSVFGAASKLATAANPIAMAGVMLGLAGVIFRQVMKFFTQRTKYMMVLAQNLYFHNLANNRGVLTLMTDRAEEEAIKENFLLYHFLVHGAAAQSRTDLKKDIETFMESEFKVNIDFDIDHALSNLKDDGLINENTKGEYTALKPGGAMQQLKTLWINSLETR